MITGIINPNKLDPRVRDLCLVVVDGHLPVTQLLYWLSSLHRFDEVLEWLIRNKITGKKLVGYFENEHEASLIKFSAYVLRRVNRDLESKPLIVGKDIR